MKLRRLVLIILMALFGGLMFVSKLLTEFIPNVHLVAMFTVSFTVVYRKYAIIAVGVFVFLTGLFNGFAMWWLPYIYLWPILWAVTMCLPRQMSPEVALPVYVTVCVLHGLLFGTMYAPVNAIMFGLDFKQTLMWIAYGFPWDLVHAGGNLLMSTTLCMPTINVLRRSTKMIG